MTSSEINKVLIQFSKRAEKIDRQILMNSFVDVGPLLTSLLTIDNQILYGRRGTGKTHALVYLSEKVKEENGVPIYIDFRSIGSTGGLYSDSSIDFCERATRLLIDTLAAAHEELLNAALDDTYGLDLSVVSPLLDELGQAISDIVVKGPVQTEKTQEATKKTADMSSGTVVLAVKPEFRSGGENHAESGSTDITQVTRKGVESHRIHFGRVGLILQKLSQNIEGKRIWFLLDEWSAIPIDLQPYLADLLRRSVFPVKLITVKIAAIEKRSRFQVFQKNGDYIGIELGADASADLNMDDLMVFDNDEEKATKFFKELIFNHFSSLLQQEGITMPFLSADALIGAAFTQGNVFQDFVRAAEGIPRDSFYILSLAAQRDVNKAISMDTLRKCSKTWYQRDKETAVSANPRALQLLHWIIDKVIANRRARAFLLEKNVSHELIDSLFDSRVIHLLKKNVASQDHPGARYDVYKIDYGCYVDLLSTARAPQGLLDTDEGKFVDVPPDDYRAIRRAILDISDFEKRN